MRAASVGAYSGKSISQIADAVGLRKHSLMAKADGGWNYLPADDV